MKILIIAANAFPMQGPRAFRTTELAEYLSKIGHDVTLYSVHGKYNYSEYEKRTGVIMRNIPHITSLTGNDGYHRYNLFDKFMYHYFNRILCWPECEYLIKVSKVIKNNPNVDLLITIAVPHAIHTGAAIAKKRYPNIFPQKWICDCGDPFMFDPYTRHPKFMAFFEKLWCALCDYITVPTKESYKGYYPEFYDKIRVIPQGFDFSKTPVASYKKNDIPTFVFAGYIYPGKRDPHMFMNYLLKCKFQYKFKIFTFKALESRYLNESNGQIEYNIGYSRKQIIYECSKADFLINIPNESSVQSPSKLIDYAISGRPILDVENDYCDDTRFLKFINGDYSSEHIIENIDSFKIENVAKQFLSLI